MADRWPREVSGSGLAAVKDLAVVYSPAPNTSEHPLPSLSGMGPWTHGFWADYTFCCRCWSSLPSCLDGIPPIVFFPPGPRAALVLLRNFRESDAMTSADTDGQRRENSQIVEPPSLESAIRPIMDVRVAEQMIDQLVNHLQTANAINQSTSRSLSFNIYSPALSLFNSS